MKFSLIVCTYMRAQSLQKLLESIVPQTLYPDEILIIDGSTNFKSQEMIAGFNFKNLTYYLVDETNRGLTKQRNFGISKVSESSEIVCFLDDDTYLKNNYFEELIVTFRNNNDIIGVGGVAINENNWIKADPNITYNSKKYYQLDGYVVAESTRNILRNYLGLQSNLLPGKIPVFSNMRTSGYPLNDKIYEVDALMGYSIAFRKSIFDKILFSSYFEGYGLYEDTDFCIRAQKNGKIVVNTKVQLSHFHEPSGRPNQYQYGKMVVRNGWYVWRIKNSKPSIFAIFKWNTIILLLITIRFSNTITTKKKKEALTESLGRISGWISLLFSKPQIES